SSTTEVREVERGGTVTDTPGGPDGSEEVSVGGPREFLTEAREVSFGDVGFRTRKVFDDPRLLASLGSNIVERGNIGGQSCDRNQLRYQRHQRCECEDFAQVASIGH